MDETSHRLICLAEECAEISEQCSKVAVRVSKALRFGLDEVQPGQLMDNVQRLAIELADILAVAELLESAGVIARVRVEIKKDKLRTFMDYAAKCGTLDARLGISDPRDREELAST
jgi:hypothetical protein